MTQSVHREFNLKKHLINLPILFWLGILAVSCALSSKTQIVYESNIHGTAELDPQTGKVNPLTEKEIIKLKAASSPNGLKAICCKEIGFKPFNQPDAKPTIIENIPWDENVFEAYMTRWTASGRKLIIGVRIIGDASKQLGRFALYALDTETLDFSLIEEGLTGYYGLSPADDLVVVVKVLNKNGYDTEDAGVYVVDLTNNTRKRIINAPYAYAIQHVVPSPNGKQLALIRSGAESSGVDLVNMDGLNLQTLWEESLNIPVWSPDNRWIAGVGSILGESIPSRLVVLDTQSHQQIITGGFVNNIIWSPDSTQVAFVQQDPDVNIDESIR